MKPIKLEMTAFGSYAQPAVVDFRRLGHCLYLITGDTGAGKTTIFDGIMFALYGVASGKGDRKFRTFEMMHCDYVDKSQDTVIRLDFEHMGKEYTVERILHFKKKRATGEYEKTTPQAKFWEPDREPLEQTDAVTARITEILGMSADQFRKIVMLAQGEFRKFLDADSEEKNQILGELFDNSAYVWFQKIFEKAREKLARRRREEGDAKIKSAMENFMAPENCSEAEREIYTAGHSGLEEALAKLAETDRILQEELEGRLRDCRDRENKLRETLGKAEEQNKKLQELARKKDALRDLQEREPDMLRLKEQAGRVEKAFHKVVPKQTLFWQAEEVYRNTSQKAEDLSLELSHLEKDTAEKKERLDLSRKENEREIERLGKDIAEIEKALPRYKELEEKIHSRKKAEKAAEKAAEKRQEIQEAKNQTAQRVAERKELIGKLDGAEAAAERCRAALDDIERKLDRLASGDGIKAQRDRIRRQEGKYREKQAELQMLLAQAGKLEDVYHHIYQAFMQGQAGLLARNLEQELKEKEEAVCPVCRTAFRKSVPHSFAEFVEGTPEQGDVDQAKAAFEKKNQERQKHAGEMAGQEAELKAARENVVSRLRELEPDCPDWETLDTTSYLEDVIGRYEKQRQGAEKEYNEAINQCELLKEWKKECAEKEVELQTYEDSFREYGDVWQTLRVEIGRLEAAAEELHKSLKYPDQKEAEARRNELQEEKDKRTAKIRTAEQTYSDAEKRYNAVSGALDSTKKSLPGFKEEKERAESSLLTEIVRQGFRDQEEVCALLKQAGEADSETEGWLQSKNAEIRDYENTLENTKKRIEELEKETQNQEKTDLDQLKSDITEREKEGSDIQNKLDLCREQYKNHRTTAEAVRNADRILKSTEGAWKRLDSLADLATGTSSEGGKISFDRYVMGYVFREVLDMANRRLDIMSGGRYELNHEMNAGRSNAKAGLEISVLDMTTGKCRPVSSLSGGESFFVSLALALGLSDVVQNHAGGKRLDALFIDEGFGTLDDDVLDHALMVLNQLTEGQRLVGIISHVAKLEESIPQQIQVKNSEKGSSLKIVS